MERSDLLWNSRETFLHQMKPVLFLPDKLINRKYTKKSFKVTSPITYIKPTYNMDTVTEKMLSSFNF